MSELDNVPVFVRVVDAGSFSSAARSLGIPKSSASRSVKQLEDALGVQLLQRTTRQLRLTEAGQAYYERVSSALAALDEARAEVAETQDAPKGLVRLAAPSDGGSWLLAPIIAHFIERYPGIRIELSLTHRDVDLVRDGFDLALRVGRLDDSSLIVRTIGTINRGLFASEDYLARRGTPQRLADLTAHDFIVYRLGSSANLLRLEGPAGPESVHVSGPVVTDQLGFVQEAVRFGLGIGLLPTSGCAKHLRLIRVLPDYSEPGLSYSLVYPSARFVPRRVALLRDALLESLHVCIATKDGGCGPGAPPLPKLEPLNGHTPVSTPAPTEMAPAPAASARRRRS